MSLADLSPPYIRAIAPYQPGKPISELAREMGLDEASIVKLASNENPLGISPLAQQALQRALPELALYPDGNGFALKAAIAKKFAVNTNQIVLGNGSNDILELVARAFLAPGDSAVYAEYCFAVYPLVTQAVGAQGVEVRAQDFGHDLAAMRAAIRSDTKVVFVANPNNPTGTIVKPGEILEFLEDVPKDVLVVLDEAYTEFLPRELTPDSLNWVKQFPNLIVSRTFSKAYGLAGLRVGFGLAHPEVADLMNRVRQPFNVNSLALAAATAALDDSDFLRRTVENNRAGMEQLTQGLRQLKLTVLRSYGNFLCFRVGDGQAVFQALLKKGVIVRPLAGYRMPDWLRVSIGRPEENDRFLQVLGEIVGQ